MASTLKTYIEELKRIFSNKRLLGPAGAFEQDVADSDPPGQGEVNLAKVI